MNKFLKIFTVFIIVILSGILTGASSDDYAVIRHYDYQGNVLTNGNFEVKEHLSFEIHAASQNKPFRELYRSYYYEKYHQDKNIQYLNLSIKELDSNGNLIRNFTPGSSITRDNGTMAFVLDGNTLEFRWYINEYRGVFYYEISYTITNIILGYNDCADLLITPYGSQDISSLRTFNAVINLPSTVNSNDVQAFFRGQRNYKITQTGNQIKFEVNKVSSNITGFTPGFIEFRLLFNENAKKSIATINFSNYDKYDDLLSNEIKIQNNYLNFENQRQLYKNIDFLILFLAVPITVVVFYLYIKINRPIKPSTNYKYFRDIPSNIEPALATGLLKKIKFINANIAAATTLSLCLKKRLEIDPGKKKGNGKDIKFIIKDRTLNGLEDVEKMFLTHIISSDENGDGNGIMTIKELTKFSRRRQNFVKHQNKAIAKNLKAKEWSIRNTLRLFPISLGIVLLASTLIFLLIGIYYFSCFAPISLLISGIILFILTVNKYPSLSQSGIDEAYKWKGLYNFFKDQTLMNEQNVTDIVKWEEYLVYATAFGVSNKVLAIIEKNMASLNTSNSSFLYHNNILIDVAIFNSLTRSFKTSISSSQSKSGSFGGGGFGGGGGGGRH